MELVLDFVLIVGFVINLTILVVLYKNKHKGFHKKILFFIFCTILISIIHSYGFLHKNQLLFYSTFIIENSITVYFGPLLLLYIYSIFLPSKNLLRKNAVHFIVPFMYVLVISTPLMISTWNKEYLFNYLEVIFNYIDFISFYSLVYCFIGLKVLKRANVIIHHYYGNTDSIDIQWIKKVLLGTITIIGINFLFFLIELILGELPWNPYYLVSACIAITIGYLGYQGLFQSKVLLPIFLLQDHFVLKEEHADLPISNQTKKSRNYQEDEMEELQSVLYSLMEHKKVYLDPDLSLASLAELLTISEKKLSTLLNQYLNISFYNYINNYRVEEVKKQIQNPHNAQYTLLALGLESGFNSKASFNRIFKNFTGNSPSEYKKQVLQQGK